MKRNFKLAAIVCVTVLICLTIAYLLALRFWTQRTAVIPVKPPEAAVFWTGTISTTNGWEFKLENLFNFGKQNAGSLIFCEKTRQLFICFGGKDDDSFSQWDLDTGKCVYTSHAGKDFWQCPEAVSPDGKYLVITRAGRGGSTPPFSSPWNTLIINVEKRTVTADLGGLGSIYECHFNRDCSKIWLWTGANVDGPVVFALDGKRITNFASEDFPRTQDPVLWDVPLSKANLNEYGLYFKDASGNTNLLTKDHWHNNYWRSKDGRIIIASNWHDEIVIWDAKTLREIVRKRITNHHNGGGWVIYDREKDRFLIADPSYQGTTYLRALLVTKQPPL